MGYFRMLYSSGRSYPLSCMERYETSDSKGRRNWCSCVSRTGCSLVYFCLCIRYWRSNDVLMHILYKFLPILFGCHQRPERSFFIKGKQFPICARCTGELAGLIIGFLGWWFVQLPSSVYILLLIPLTVDGFIQLLTPYESTNLKRFLTGVLFGIGLISLFIMTSTVAYQFGLSII